MGRQESPIGKAGELRTFGSRPHPPASDPHNTPTMHAFVMLGTETLFLCHLTMYHMEEHKYQLIVRAKLPQSASEQYKKQRRQHPTETYFLGNTGKDLLTLPKLVSGMKAFKGDVFRGIPDQPTYESWPWANEKPLIKNVQVNIERVVYYRHFDLNMDYPHSLTYILFGSGKEAHMTHYQTKEPDFDQVVSLEEPPTWLSQDQLKASVHINIPALRRPSNPPVYCTNPLTERIYQAQYFGEGPLRPIKLGVNYWFCTKIANHENPCEPQNQAPCASPPPKS